jgi:hypothetical protein
MLETLTSLKNNKLKQATAQQAQRDTAEQLKKFLAGLGKTRHRRLFQLFLLLYKINANIQ